jgi:riboflavin synthase
MFTGLVEETGLVRAVARGPRGGRLTVSAGERCAASGIGASLAVNGVCLTVVERGPDGLAFDLGPETLERTALGDLRPGDAVNLERPLRVGGELGGHFVLGHVDGVGVVAGLERTGESARLAVALVDRELEPLVVPQGSIAVDGVSLTVAALEPMTFHVMLIPHTLAVTTLGRARPGGRMNLEMDVIGKYVLRALSRREPA